MLVLLSLACAPTPELPTLAEPKATTPVLTWKRAGQEGDWLGYALAGGEDVSGDGLPDVALAAPVRVAATEPGAVDLWFGGSTDLGTARDATVNNPGTDPDADTFGDNLSLGDANGDGFADLFVAEARWNGTNHRVAGYRSNGLSLGTGPRWSLPSPNIDDDYGDELVTLDFNGDGYRDLLVSAPWTNVGSDRRGALWLWLGSAMGPRTGRMLRADADLVGDTQFGGTLAAVGDTNGDGYDDFLVGAMGAGSSASNGRVHWYSGSRMPSVPTRAPWTVAGTSGSLGSQLAGMGDLDGDGYDDFAVLDARTDDIYVIDLYRGGALGPSGTPAWTVVTDSADRVGLRLCACDLDGDGAKDLALRAWDTEEVHVYTHVTDEPTTRTWTLGDSSASDFGSTLTCAGDLDGDGREELLVGDQSYDVLGTNRGAAWIYSVP